MVWLPVEKSCVEVDRVPVAVEVKVAVAIVCGKPVGKVSLVPMVIRRALVVPEKMEQVRVAMNEKDVGHVPVVASVRKLFVVVLV